MQQESRRFWMICNFLRFLFVNQAAFSLGLALLGFQTDSTGTRLAVPVGFIYLKVKTRAVS